MGWIYQGRCLDGVMSMVDGRTELIEAVIKSYPVQDAGVKFLSATPTFNTGTGILTVSEKLNVTTATATSRTIQLQTCTDELVRCVPSERTIAPCQAGFAPAAQGGSVNANARVAYQEVFGAVPVQDIGAVAILAIAFVLGLARGLKA